MTDDLAAVEDELKELFSLAAATLPAAPPLEWNDYRSTASEPTTEWKRLRWPARLGLMGTAVLGLAGVGTGIAAAAGAFSAPTPKEVWGAAYDLTLTGTWTQPTEVTRVVAPGPDGTTLYVGSSSVPQGTCEALATSRAGAATPTIDGSSCQGSIHTSLTPGVRSTYSASTAGWSSPTGTQYALSYGPAPSGTTSVAFVSSAGDQLVTGTASGGWYVIAVPANDVGHGSAVTFYGSTGASLGTRPASGEFATPTTSAQSHVPSATKTKGSGGVAPMYAVGYKAVKFTRTGQAVLSLTNGRSVTVPEHVAVEILQGRAKGHTPPLLVTGTVPPTVPATS